jgi:HK97 family phage portal protein
MGSVDGTTTRFQLSSAMGWHFGAYPTTSGQSVTVDRAMNLSTTWACIRLLSQTVSSLPLTLYRRDADGTPQPATKHPLFEVLADQPNADFSAVELIEGAVLHLCTRGNAFAEVDRRGDGSVVSLTLLHPDLMQVLRDQRGVRHYFYSDPYGPRIGHREIFPESILHLRGFGPGGDLGLSPIAFGRQSLGLGLAADDSAGRVFGSGGQPSGFLGWAKDQEPPTPEQWKQMYDRYFGPDSLNKRPGNLALIPAGMSFQPIGLSPEDSQMLESRAFSVEDICRWFDVPPFMVGHTAKSTSFGTGLEQQNLAFLIYKLRPYLKRICAAIRQQLLLPQERVEYFADFNTEALLQTDSAARANYYKTMVGAALMTANEARRKLNLPPLPGGDVLRVQMQDVPASDQIGHNGGPPLTDEGEQG